jgi:hypothetical protein
MVRARRVRGRIAQILPRRRVRKSGSSRMEIAGRRMVFDGYEAGF